MVVPFLVVVLARGLVAVFGACSAALVAMWSITESLQSGDGCEYSKIRLVGNAGTHVLNWASSTGFMASHLSAKEAEKGAHSALLHISASNPCAAM